MRFPAARDLFLWGALNWPFIAVGCAYALAVVPVGIAIYQKLSWKFAEVV